MDDEQQPAAIAVLVHVQHATVLVGEPDVGKAFADRRADSGQVELRKGWARAVSSLIGTTLLPQAVERCRANIRPPRAILGRAP
jgi:hypothetical protein